MNDFEKKILGDYSRLMMEIHLIEKNLDQKVYPKKKVPFYETMLKEKKEEFEKAKVLMDKIGKKNLSLAGSIQRSLK